MKNFMLLFVVMLMTTTVKCAIPFSDAVVRVPSQLDFLTEYIQTGYYSTGTVSATYLTKTSGGITTTAPCFSLAMGQTYKPLTVEFASAYVEGTEDQVIVSGNTYTFANETYILNGGSLTKVFYGTPQTFPVMLNVSAPLTGKTVEQVVDYFGADFVIQQLTIVLPNGGISGFYSLEQVDKSATVKGGCVLVGTVSSQRVLKDMIAQNIYDRKGKFLVGPYPTLNSKSTIYDLPQLTFTTMYTRPLADQPGSIFMVTTIDNGYLKNNAFIGKQLWSSVTFPIKRPDGVLFTPTYIVSLYNEPAKPYTVDVMGSKVGRGNANDFCQFASFNEFPIVELTDPTKDGYIDHTNGTIYVQPAKKCVICVEMTNSRMGDQFGKTWGCQGAINYRTNQWSKFYYSL